jgi:hypothetical protein
MFPPSGKKVHGVASVSGDNTFPMPLTVPVGKFTSSDTLLSAQLAR